MRVLVSVAAVGLLVALGGCSSGVKPSGGSGKAPDPAAEPEGDPKVAPMPREVGWPRAGGDNVAGPVPPAPEVAPPPRPRQ